MIRRKPNQEALTKSGAITTAVLVALAKAAKPGATGAELDRLAETMIRDADGVPAFLGHQGFPASICLSVNDQLVHGIPSDQKLADGDLVTFDVGVKVDGWYTDAAITVEVGKTSAAAKKLRKAAEQALEIALAEVRPGKTTGDLGAAVQAYVEGEGFSVIRDCVGHGIGKKLHEDPSIPNFGTAGEGTAFKAGMVVAVEPMIATGDYQLKLDPDRWTLRLADGGLGAHAEETVIVTDGEPIRLTPARQALSGKKRDGKLKNVAYGR